MRWDDLPQSDNIEDRRGDGGGYSGGGGGFPMGGGGLGIGGVIVLGLIGWALGIDPRLLISGAEILGGSGSQYEQQSRPANPNARQAGTPTDDSGKFIAAVLGSADAIWKDIFTKEGLTYRSPRLVMFSGGTNSGCGEASSAMGPFYCPSDNRVYLDTSFFRDLEVRFRGCNGKACQFAQAYVIAHEVGHHVQNLLGILPKAQQQQRQLGGDRAAANRIQVRVELQADCFAGIWANRAEQRWKFIDPGDIDAALQTASAIGDDMLQRKAQGRVVPDSFTHGTSEQRKHWFSVGFKQGSVAACNTFAGQV
jgi:predicted metalloprotease